MYVEKWNTFPMGYEVDSLHAGTIDDFLLGSDKLFLDFGSLSDDFRGCIFL